jgi:surfactin synthase thioesterase subunit
MNADARARWWPLGPPRETARERLLCFPYAGAGASVFRSWRPALETWLDVGAVQLPGREARIREPAFRRMTPLAEALSDVLQPWLRAPFAFFGYSMGALVAYELAHRLREARRPGPRALFVAASAAPRRVPRPDPLHPLPDDEFKAALRDLEGTPEEVLAHAELMELLLPTLRADFEVCETYVLAEREPLDCPIVAFRGERDASVPADALEAWRPLTRGAFRAVAVAAGHFFLASHAAELQRRVRETLREAGAAARGTRP